MAISVSKRKSNKHSKKVKEEDDECCYFHRAVVFKFLSKIPTAILLAMILFIWSSSTTILSEKMIHVCVSSRKLSNLYCLSAGSKPNFEIPIPSLINNVSITATSTSVEKAVVEAISGQVPSPIINMTTYDTTSSYNSSHAKEIINIREIGDKLDKNRKEEFSNAVKAIEEQLRVHRSWAPAWSKYRDRTNCEGKGIYVYDLPSKFNKDLMAKCNDLVPWMDFCNYLSNKALGERIEELGKGWYKTHQYSLEPIYHSRVLNHPCRVYNENEAKLFYVPFYGGLDVLRWHFKNVTNDVKDSLGFELIKWLEEQIPWGRKSGRDHVFVLGKISWDFRRSQSNSNPLWGTNFLELDQMQNPIKLLIERQPWHENDIGIPHPTYFHPHSDDDIFAWQWKIIRSYRKSLAGFAGAARPNEPDSIRSLLINQCNSIDHSSKCKHLDCSVSGGCGPQAVIELFTESEFCLQPPGDSPTRKSVFDSLVSGCIPVFFDPFTAYYQYPWHLPEDYSKYSVFIDKEELRKKEVNVVDMLMNVTVETREEMRSFIVYELMPGLVYSDSDSEISKFDDAFSLSMNNLLKRVDTLE